MEGEFAQIGVAMQITHGCLVASIRAEISDAAMLEIRTEILTKVGQTGVKGVIIDLAEVDILDSFLAQAVLDTGRMISLLGAVTVIVGLKPELVSVLVDLGLEFKDVLAALTLEQGFEKLRPIVEHEEKPGDTEELQETGPETAEETRGDSEEEPAEIEQPADEAADKAEKGSQEDRSAEDEA
jgi:rsbT antagonist protein RsbS